ncbi:chemotaxis protein CheR, partial [Pseudomonas syringae pv. actinidiae]|nr:chemotaxis protein CheR [Pseudomonas syringae pv. actinidiae]
MLLSRVLPMTGTEVTMHLDRSVEIELRLLIEAIYLQYSYDFRDYSGASIKRRVIHALRQFDCATISALQERVLHDPAAFMQLLQILTIPVSEMFRDPSHFLAIRKEVVPVLRTYPSIKVWIAGCSTGEEVYSTAILLREEGLLERTII